MSIVEEIIKKIENSDEVEVMAFDFAQCFRIMRDMEDAMKTFIDRVDNGEIRSTKTYKQFKDILGL